MSDIFECWTVLIGCVAISLESLFRKNEASTPTEVHGLRAAVTCWPRDGEERQLFFKLR